MVQVSENLPNKVILSREKKWIEMLADFEKWKTKSPVKLRSRCRKGIPKSMRSHAWMHLSGAFILKTEHPGYYAKCLANPNNVNIDRYVDDIKKDLHRQFSNNEMFKKSEGRETLFNVLKAHDTEVGYCQAQGPIAAMLLMQMDEEDAFWMLVIISDTYLKGYFKSGLEKVYSM